MGMEEENPVVLLSENVWHVVAHSRTSRQALCGKRLVNRQAHSRLRTIGVSHLCPKCRKLLGLEDDVTDH